MDMEGIFQELMLSVGLSVAVWYIIMKLQSNSDGGAREDFHGQQALVYDICESKIPPWPFADLLEKLSVENLCENGVLCRGEISSELVVIKHAEALQDLNKQKYMVEDDVGESRTKDEVADVSCKGSNSCEIEVALAEEENVDESRTKDEAADVSCKGWKSEVALVYQAAAAAEGLERPSFDENESGSSEDVEVRKDNLEEVSSIHYPDGNKEKEGIDALKEDDDWVVDEEDRLFDDWEGIEITELEKLFGAAVAFVGSKSNAGRISRDLKIQLHGVHKVAIDGPCQGTRPMPLKVSARAKWNSWRRLGNMNRELAMEQYLILLTQSIPEWMINKTLQCCPP